MYGLRKSVAASRVLLTTGTALALGALILFASPSTAERTLTVASFGGAYASSQENAFIEPFRKATKRDVEVVAYSGGLTDLREQVGSGAIEWDLVDMPAVDVIRGCEEGLLEPLDGLPLSRSPEGIFAEDDFYQGSMLPCGIGQNIWATVIAYDGKRYPEDKAPETLADFFDLERYPGPRGLRKTARVNLQWALLADGVSPASIYDLLETDEGLARAFAALERIRPAIVWWTEGEEPLDLLLGGDVAMTSAWSGRVYFRNRDSGGPIGTIWDHNIWEREFWVIPKGAPNAAAAKELISFASEPARQAAHSAEIAYSPARRSAVRMLASDLQPYLPTEPTNARQGLTGNAPWWARNRERLEAAFLKWADGGAQ